jgi:hypothetical protein
MLGDTKRDVDTTPAKTSRYYFVVSKLMITPKLNFPTNWPAILEVATGIVISKGSADVKIGDKRRGEFYRLANQTTKKHRFIIPL